MDQNEGFGIPEMLDVLKPNFIKDALDKSAAIPIAEETPEQRMARLQHLADLQIGRETDAEIIERLVAEARAKRAAELLPMDTAGFPADYDRVEIYEGQGEHDLPYVPLTLNGYCIKAPRGVEVILPHVFVTECLDHAIETRVTQSKGGLTLRSAHRFPYRAVGKATPDEYKAYQKQQKELATQQLAAAA